MSTAQLTVQQRLYERARMISAIHKEVFKGGLALQAVSNPYDISTIVTVQDNAISRHYLETGIDGFPAVQQELPGSFSEELDSVFRTTVEEAEQLDPIDGTGDLKKSTSTDPKDVEFRQKYGITQPYGATTLLSILARDNTDQPYISRGGLILDPIARTAILGTEARVELYRAEADQLVPVAYRLQHSEWQSGERIRIGKRVAYPHAGFDAFLEYLQAKGVDLEIMTVGGAGRMAEQCFMTNMEVEDLELKEEFAKYAIDVVVNTQADHKTWDLDPTLAMREALNVTMPTDVYGEAPIANAAAKDLKYGAWHTKGYIYSARGQALHNFMAEQVRAFERDTGYDVLKSVKQLVRKAMA